MGLKLGLEWGGESVGLEQGGDLTFSMQTSELFMHIQMLWIRTSNTIPARGSDGRANTLRVACGIVIQRSSIPTCEGSKQQNLVTEFAKRDYVPHSEMHIIQRSIFCNAMCNLNQTRTLQKQ